MQGPPPGGPHHPPFPGAGGGAFPAGNRPGMPLGQQQAPQPVARTQEQEDAIIEEKVGSCNLTIIDPSVGLSPPARKSVWRRIRSICASLLGWYQTLPHGLKDTARSAPEGGSGSRSSQIVA